MHHLSSIISYQINIPIGYHLYYKFTKLCAYRGATYRWDRPDIYACTTIIRTGFLAFMLMQLNLIDSYVISLHTLGRNKTSFNHFL